MAVIANKRYDTINVNHKDVEAYRTFEWVRSNDRPENVKSSGKKAPDTVLKRKLPFGENPALAECEKKYFKLYKKKYRQKPILGIISFLLMVAFFAVAVFELYIGLSAAFAKPTEETPAEAATLVAVSDINLAGEDDEDTEEKSSGGLKGIMDNINDSIFNPIVGKYLKDIVVYISDESVISVNSETEEEYVLKDTKILVKEIITDEEDDSKKEEKTTEIIVPADAKVYKDSNGKKYIYLEGTAQLIAVNELAEKFGLESFLNAEVFVGIIALILFIIFLILFIEVAKIKKKRAKKFATLSELEYQARSIIEYMYTRNPSLLSKAKRKELMWTNIIANGIRQAHMNNNSIGDEDDEEE